MGWKGNLLGQMNSVISQKQDATFAVHNAKQAEWGEMMLKNIFSTLHLNMYLKLDFKIIPVTDQDKISVGDILEHECHDDKPGERVIHDEHGAGEITLTTYIGPKEIFYIKFDELEDEVIIDRNDPKLKFEYDIKRKLEHADELDRIQAGSMVEAKEIEDMDNETLVNEFEQLIRNGAGYGYRRVLFMKKEMLKRMNRGDHL